MEKFWENGLSGIFFYEQKLLTGLQNHDGKFLSGIVEKGNRITEFGVVPLAYFGEGGTPHRGWGFGQLVEGS